MKNKNYKACVLIDGNKNISNLELEQRLFAKGDQRIFSIAAASINAKVYRDELMKEYHQKFPEYGFDKHKGYGTKFHMEQLRKVGACSIHRRSFAPVKEVL
jgi:ribonuclease HII